MKPLIYGLLLCLIMLFAIPELYCQTIISGKVKEVGGQSVPFANVYCEKSERGTSANYKGEFRLENIPGDSIHLFSSAVGYSIDEKELDLSAGDSLYVEFTLREDAMDLEEVVVTGTMKETYLKDSPVKIEVISQKFLKSNPENNIIESLKNINGVQQQVGCGVCGTNSIRINGMEGPYTLVLIDGMPIMSNLASVYGFNGIPNSMIERVEILKGPSSTLYGTEAVAGVINIITKSPDHMPLVSVNSFLTTHGESSTDFSFSPELNEKVNTTISGNFFHNDYKLDANGDNFTDFPLSTRLSLFNKWEFGELADIAFRYYTEDRAGGVMEWKDKFRGSDSIYGESIYTDRYEMIGSLSLPFDENIRLDYSGSYHFQDSYYGNTHYVADQSVLFSNLLWNKKLDNHQLLVGITNRYQTYRDNSPTNSDDYNYIPGIFVQDQYHFTEKTELLGGLRLDHHTDHGLIFSPRLNVKHDPGKYTSLRLNMGTGFRQVNLFTEDHAALSGSRTLVIKEDLKPEKSYSAAFNLNQVYSFVPGTGTFDVDLFYTYFSNRILPDYESEDRLIIYKNLNGYSISRGAALSVNHEFTFPLELGFGGTYQDVFKVYPAEGGEQSKEDQVFTPGFSGTFKISYEHTKTGIRLDYTGIVTGSQKLPEAPEGFEIKENTPWYSLQNLQLSKSWHHFELYGGVKNIFNRTQESPLIDPQNPFGEDFDTIYAWGPLQTRRFYLGVRWSFFGDKHDQ